MIISEPHTAGYEGPQGYFICNKIIINYCIVYHARMHRALVASDVWRCDATQKCHKVHMHATERHVP